MAIANRIEEPDRWFNTAKRLLTGPAGSATCTGCGERVYARPVFASATSMDWYVPVDEQGRCASCAWVASDAH